MAAPTAGRLSRSRHAERHTFQLPQHATWLAPLITVATLFFLWPV